VYRVTRRVLDNFTIMHQQYTECSRTIPTCK